MVVDREHNLGGSVTQPWGISNATLGDQSQLGGVARTADLCQSVACEEHSGEADLPALTPAKDDIPDQIRTVTVRRATIYSIGAPVRTMTEA
jgi:hypothetical protein